MRRFPALLVPVLTAICGVAVAVEQNFPPPEFSFGYEFPSISKSE